KRALAGARVEHIARRAGVNKQLLFYYYHSKRGLFQAVLTQAAGELEAALAALALHAGRPPPIERLRLALDAQFDFLAGHPELVALLAHSGRGVLAPFVPAIQGPGVLLAGGRGLGQVRDDLGPYLTAAHAPVRLV